MASIRDKSGTDWAEISWIDRAAGKRLASDCQPVLISPRGAGSVASGLVAKVVRCSQPWRARAIGRTWGFPLPALVGDAPNSSPTRGTRVGWGLGDCSVRLDFDGFVVGTGVPQHTNCTRNIPYNRHNTSLAYQRYQKLIAPSFWISKNVDSTTPW